MVAIQTQPGADTTANPLCITFLSKPRRAIRIISGGATTPLMTAV
jgi:hypothetical protein